ncbi:autotransporter assembly complex protein TamB [Serratia marcescens]|uniref:autotransporter assembly complex protein TamB n=1 Tax=Serratia TaxID=613 RepID=UPI0007454C99|nr:translocation/assembly module TamB domain-containing protein [Serratia marcescens]EIY8595331.1 translocation/assembly module TamB [Serratia marcescens]EIY8854076.1 translocation/assembly module TamB [Serratia marcescens]EIY8864089.1 translocation/assembly module TamB [Serratia marcescens]EIY9013589.1 translocation/assembly module TamB [Serratia marcescens]ELD1858624.1 translocation/assembly module TamB [Serratia marcescens]
MSLVKKICLGFLVVLLLLIGGLAFLIGTTTGLHMVINGAARWVPGLEIASVSGGWRDLTLKGVKYQMPGVTVNAGQFHLSLDLSCFKRSSLCVNALTAQDVDVAVNTKEMAPSAPVEESSEPTTNLSTPYPITLRLLALNNVKVTVDDTAISLAEFRTGAQWQERALTLMPTKIGSLLIALPKTPQNPLPEAVQPAVEVAKKVGEQVTDAAKPAPQPEEKPLGETLKELFAKPLLPDLPDIRLPLDITVKEISGEQLRLTGDTDVLITSLLLQASTQDQHIQLDNFDVKSPQGTLSLQGQATLTGDWPVSLTANSALNIEPLKGEKVKLNVGGGLRDELKVALNLSGPVGAQLDVQTRLAEAGLPLALTLQSKQLKWPLSGEAQYQVNDFRLRFNGKATDYALSTRANLKGQDLPPAVLTLDGKGNVEQFKLERLRLAALQGNTDLTALVDWSKAISWNSQLTLSGINTAKQWPEWPAKLDGKITTRGSLHGGSWQLQVPVLQLDGNVKQNKVTARGTLSGNAAGQWKIPGIDLALGRNQLNVKGQLDEKSWNLDANIDAPRLDGALPGLGGTAKGLLKLRGNLQAPQLLADLTASGLQWQALRINRVKIDGDVRSTDQIQGQLAVRVEQLKQDALEVSLLTLDAKGSEKQHQLQLKIDGKPVSGQLALQGSFDRQQQRWRGNLNNTRFDTPVGEWRLTRAIALDYLNTEQKISVGPHCWQNPNAELCVPKTIEAGQSGQASVVLNRFDLAMIKPFLGPETALSGVFTGRADVSWKPGGALPEAKVTLAGNGVKVVQQVQGNALPIAFDTLTLNAGLNNGRALADWRIKLTNNGQFDGNIQVADPQVRRTISGNVNITNISLALINPALMKGESAAGMLNANLRLGGSAQKPLVFGRLALDRAKVQGHWMPFDMTDARLAVNFNGMTSTLEGLLSTTRGQLNLAGDADWRDINAWRARIAAKGDKLRVTVPPMIRIDVSPDLVFEATPQLFSLNGKVDIPWARITVQELPESAVGVSSDEVMLDDQLKPIQPKTASIPINSNLMIHVGNDVRLDAFGLKARLKGDLKVVQDKKGLGLNGQIDIPSGRFHAYGQDLIVRKGQLMFSGPPDQPLLNIEAIRNPESTEDDVTAGVRVTGLADAPKLEVFSDPAKSQQEALSYLLRGQGLSSSGADGNAMTSMLIGMGVAQSGQLVGKIGEAFGVSNLALDTQGVGDSSQVVVSGYVLPGLQVKYGVGIFDSLATLTLRYRLMPKLYLEAVSGLDQALDLLYQFEF